MNEHCGYLVLYKNNGELYYIIINKVTLSVILFEYIDVAYLIDKITIKNTGLIISQFR